MKEKLEAVETFRIVCHGSGLPGHNDHVFNYPTREQAETMLDKRTREWSRNDKTKKCTPFHLESRMISPWFDESVAGSADIS